MTKEQKNWSKDIRALYNMCLLTGRLFWAIEMLETLGYGVCLFDVYMDRILQICSRFTVNKTEAGYK